jgi:hypothetical protein
MYQCGTPAFSSTSSLCWSINKKTTVKEWHLYILEVIFKKKKNSWKGRWSDFRHNIDSCVYEKGTGLVCDVTILYKIQLSSSIYSFLRKSSFR